MTDVILSRAARKRLHRVIVARDRLADELGELLLQIAQDGVLLEHPLDDVIPQVAAAAGLTDPEAFFPKRWRARLAHIANQLQKR